MSIAPEIPLQVITPKDVRASVRRAKASLEKAAEEIVWQIEREAWRTLGYTSWNAMREAEYGDAAFMVPRKERPELVGRMRRAGLTQQEIADTAGVSRRSVERDLNATNAHSDDAPTITNARGQQRPAAYTKSEPSNFVNPGEQIIPSDEPLSTADFCRDCGADLDGCTCRTSDATTGAESAAPVAITVTCPTCDGTGKVTR